MLKQIFTSLLLVAISFTQCISADDEYKRKGWEIDTEVDDLTDEITSYRVRLEYSKLRPVKFYYLSIVCDMNTKKLNVSIGGGSDLSSWVTPIAGSGLRMSEDVTAEYRFNQESVLKEVWKISKAGPVFAFESLNPVGFAHELLWIMEGEKTQFRF